MDWWIGGLVDETHEFRCLNESSLSASKLNDCSAEKDLSSALSSALREFRETLRLTCTSMVESCLNAGLLDELVLSRPRRPKGDMMTPNEITGQIVEAAVQLHAQLYPDELFGCQNSSS